METTKKVYYILSGEGTEGTWEATNPITEIGLKRRLTQERCGGDRWARAFVELRREDDDETIVVSDGDSIRYIDTDDLA